MQPMFNVGLGGEPIRNWKLISMSNNNGTIKSVYEATSKKYHKIYHLEDFSNSAILLEQHLTLR